MQVYATGPCVARELSNKAGAQASTKGRGANTILGSFSEIWGCFEDFCADGSGLCRVRFGFDPILVRLILRRFGAAAWMAANHFSVFAGFCGRVCSRNHL